MNGNKLNGFFAGVGDGTGCAAGFAAPGGGSGAFGGVPEMCTGVPTEAVLKKRIALSLGRRTQPCEEGKLLMMPMCRPFAPSKRRKYSMGAATNLPPLGTGMSESAFQSITLPVESTIFP